MSTVDSVSLSSAFAAANRGPLTSIFTPPASCLEQTTIVTYTTTSTEIPAPTTIFTTTKVFVNHYSWGNQDCYPSTVGNKWGNGYYYSPGICPSGWTSACTQKTSLLGWPTTLADDTTAVICCPQNYGCIGSAQTGHQCSTALVKGQTLTSVWLAPTPTSGQDLDVPSQRPLVDYTVPEQMTALCDAIPVLWKKSDTEIIALLTSETAAPSFTSLLTATGIPSTRNSPLPFETSGISSTPLPSSSPSSSLSSSAKIAIGISIPLVFISIVLGIFCIFRCQRRRHHKRPTVRHEFASPIPSKSSYRYTNSDKWSAYSGTGSEAHLMPIYKNPFADGATYPADAKLSDHWSPRSVQLPVFEKDAGSMSRGHLVEMGPGRREEEVMELADTSRFSVRKWRDSAKSSSKNSRKSAKFDKTKISSPVPDHERSWFDASPPSPELPTPSRAKFQQIDAFF